MIFHELSYAKELLTVANHLGIKITILEKEKSINYIKFIFDKYKPWKTTGHVSIDNDINKPVSMLLTEDNEFTFSLSMNNVPAFIFFEQNYINKNNVLIIHNASKISHLMENSSGMEYFISDEIGSYLIAVNWYSIEFTGDIILKSGQD